MKALTRSLHKNTISKLKRELQFEHFAYFIERMLAKQKSKSISLRRITVDSLTLFLPTGEYIQFRAKNHKEIMVYCISRGKGITLSRQKKRHWFLPNGDKLTPTRLTKFMLTLVRA